MAEGKPIELPSLSAQRGEPSAAVCAGGHLIAWHVDAPLPVRYCAKCGDPILFACPACGAPLPADPEMLQWVPYHGNCPQCGSAYPWKAADIARAKRTLAERAEVEQWPVAVKARADALVDDIAGDRAAASGVVAGIQWLAQHGAESASGPILDAVERLAGATLKQALRPSFPGQF